MKARLLIIGLIWSCVFGFFLLIVGALVLGSGNATVGTLPRLVGGTVLIAAAAALAVLGIMGIGLLLESGKESTLRRRLRKRRGPNEERTESPV